ncbi:MAG: peptidase M20 [Herpetosiphonaceae bacterium]|nr:MAG: peptidase M20 [Herpetosiphonaceae bacterium]
MADVQTITLDLLLSNLRQLCALRSIAGDQRSLIEAAEAIASLMQQSGLHAMVIRTSGAPVVLAERPGRTSQQVLFYDHYDVAPPGPWRDWHHEPFSLAERDGVIYGRGVVSKGNLAARLGAVAAILAVKGELPVGVKFLIEGEALIGSPSLPGVIADQAGRLSASLVVGTGGSIGAHGVPYLYAGVKGRLQVQLRANGPAVPLPPEAAASVANPAWRLLWALASIKSDAEEVLIDQFYDDVEPVPRELVRLVRSIVLDEEARLKAWQINHFLFEMSGPALARAEVLNPTCNLTSFAAGSGTLPMVPDTAAALIDFTLVPNQRPAHIVELLRRHLEERGFSDIIVEPINGAFPAARTAMDDPLVRRVVKSVGTVYGEEPQVVPMAPFASPLHLFTAGMRTPAIALGLARPDSSTRGPNEGLRLCDIEAMARLIARLLQDIAK